MGGKHLATVCRLRTSPLHLASAAASSAAGKGALLSSNLRCALPMSSGITEQRCCSVHGLAILEGGAVADRHGHRFGQSAYHPLLNIIITL